MFKRLVVKPNSYYDSIVLMRLARTVRNIDNIAEAQVGMATDLNKDAVREMGLESRELEKATPNDLIVALLASTQDALDNAEQAIAASLESPTKQEPGAKSAKVYATLTEAATLEDAGIAAISVPWEYAAREARTALNCGLHVFLFSDNVSLEDEVALKRLGKEKGLFVMGPDCGTAVINGLGLGFANKVRQGKIGIVAASGTGMQQVMAVVDHLGEGISEAIGTGGRDLSQAVGGITTRMGLDFLDAHHGTAVKLLISKPPHPGVRDSVMRWLEEGTKPAVVCFMGEKRSKKCSGKVFFADDLEDAAVLACRLANEGARKRLHSDTELDQMACNIMAMGGPSGFFRGLYCGGTLCYETMAILAGIGMDVYSNIAQKPELLLQSAEESLADSCIDMGDDYFTRGRPHPMIEPAIRVPRYLAEARSKDVGVLMFDVVLGYGCHRDPAGVMAEAVKEASRIRKDMKQGLIQIAVVVGTSGDPQGLDGQIAVLRDAGAIVLTSNRAGGELVARIRKAEGGIGLC